jgi:hypothetical protein
VFYDRKNRTIGEVSRMTEQQRQDRELGLYDLIDILLRKKWTVLSITLLLFSLSVAHSLMREPIHRYYLDIQLGTLPGEGEQKLIESPETVVHRLNQSIIPHMVSSFFQGGDQSVPVVKSSVPRRGQALIILSGKGPLSMREDYYSILAEIGDSLREEHGVLLARERERLSLELQKELNQIMSLRDQVGLEQARENRLGARKKSLHYELRELERALELAGAKESQMVLGEDTVMILYLLESEKRWVKARISEIRDELEIGLPDRREELRVLTAGRQRDVELLQAQLDLKLKEAQRGVETMPISLPQQSNRPVNYGPLMMGSLGLVMGLLWGLFGALLLEFAGNVRMRRLHR